MVSSIDPNDININEIEASSSTITQIEVPFELAARDFIGFAKYDLEGDLVSDNVNALSNIKRSIDCLFDSLLFAVNFLEDSKRERWNFPEKMKFLREIGIITPYILRRINSARNLLEHEFKKPVRQDIEMAYDVAVLLYYATARFTKGYVRRMDLTSKDETWILKIQLKRKTRTIKVSGDNQDFFVSWDEDPEKYKKWLYVIYQAWYLSI